MRTESLIELGELEFKSNTLEEWDLDVPTVVLKRSGPTGSGSYYSNIEFGILVHRKSWYYASKIMAIVYMLTLVSWTVLFLLNE